MMWETAAGSFPSGDSVLLSSAPAVVFVLVFPFRLTHLKQSTPATRPGPLRFGKFVCMTAAACTHHRLENWYGPSSSDPDRLSQLLCLLCSSLYFFSGHALVMDARQHPCSQLSSIPLPLSSLWCFRGWKMLAPHILRPR